MVCNDAVENLVEFVLLQTEIFPKFSDYLLAFIQNLLSNILTINYSFNEIVAETAKPYDDPDDPRNDTKIWFLYGAMVESILNVQPLETGSLSEGVSLNSSSPGSLNPDQNSLDPNASF
mmetsp:Transcript_10442/g.10492  ORF Transcript_10442/g.10492 Transcript_10442/m.10492 type:complete len:119 (+) Transcript_10442:403-759(+)